MYAIMGADLLSLWFVVLSVPIYPCQHSFRTFFFSVRSLLIIHQRYMNRKAARHIAQSIQRLPYLECLNELQSIALIYDFDVDFDYVYFNDIEIPIAAIFGFEIKDNFLFILTKKQQLYYINLTTKLCDMILLNQSMYDIIITKLKLLFNSKL